MDASRRQAAEEYEQQKRERATEASAAAKTVASSAAELQTLQQQSQRQQVPFHDMTFKPLHAADIIQGSAIRDDTYQRCDLTSMHMEKATACR